MKILILFAHPAFHKSNVNKHLVDGLEDLEGVTFHDLYEQYPEFDIDVEYEQELLIQHDCIIFHHPFFWYSTPAILKEWQDIVLKHDWAFGSKGNALKDKLFFNVVTTGAPEQLYSKEHLGNYSIKDFLIPISQSATLCKMISLPPFVVHGTYNIKNNEILEYKKEYLSLLNLIIDNKFEADKAIKMNYLNDYLKQEEI